MRFPTQFTQTAPTINAPVPSVSNTVTPFSDLVGKAGPVNADFYGLINRPRYNPTAGQSPGQVIVRNRRNFGYVAARATMRWNPTVRAAGAVVGIVTAIISRPESRQYDFTGYTKLKDCNRTTTYVSTIAGFPGCVGLYTNFNTAIDASFVTSRPANIWTWEFSHPHPTLPDRHYSFANERYKRTVTLGPPVINDLPPMVFAQDPFTQNGSPGSQPLVLARPWVQLPNRWNDPGVGSHPDEDTGGEPSSQTSDQPLIGDRPKPPPGGTKEKKMRLRIPWFNAGKRNAQQLGHLTTEGLDWLECLWKALPESARTKPSHRLGDMPGAQSFNPNALVTNPQEKINDVYQGWQKIDWAGRRNPDGSLINAKQPGALACLVANHFSDEVIGRIAGGAQSEATKRDVILGLLG